MCYNSSVLHERAAKYFAGNIPFEGCFLDFISCFAITCIKFYVVHSFSLIGTGQRTSKK